MRYETVLIILSYVNAPQNSVLKTAMQSYFISLLLSVRNLDRQGHVVMACLCFSVRGTRSDDGTSWGLRGWEWLATLHRDQLGLPPSVAAAAQKNVRVGAQGLRVRKGKVPFSSSLSLWHVSHISLPKAATELPRFKGEDINHGSQWKKHSRICGHQESIVLTIN